MKRVGSIKQALKPSLKSSSDAANNNESKMNNSPNRTSILGNVEPKSNGFSNKPDFHIPKSISSFLKKGTLSRNKKDKSQQVSFQGVHFEKTVLLSMLLISLQHLPLPFASILKNDGVWGRKQGWFFPIPYSNWPT